MTKYERPERVGEINSGEIIVDKFDYIPANVQIDRLIKAGERLRAHRRKDYDFADGEKIPEDFIDPTRDPSYDLADVTAFQQAWEEKKRILSAKAEQKEELEIQKESTPKEEKKEK